MDNRYYKNQRKEVYEMVPPFPQRVLEIGCAEGGFKENFSSDIALLSVLRSFFGDFSDAELGRIKAEEECDTFHESLMKMQSSRPASTAQTRSS